MRKVLELIEHVAKTEATVLILGESGTGKELVARAIHAASKRRYAPIVAVNCGGLPDSLLESELFGHEKGAFTGADEPRKGKIEMADGGTLFLDEVGAINAKMQVDLLRVLETHEVFRLGADRPKKVDFPRRLRHQRQPRPGDPGKAASARISITASMSSRSSCRPCGPGAATSPPWPSTSSIASPGRWTAASPQISPEAMELLMDQDWPGNVRELSNAIERAMVVGRPPAIMPGDLPIRQRAARHAAGAIAGGG